MKKPSVVFSFAFLLIPLASMVFAAVALAMEVYWAVRGNPSTSLTWMGAVLAAAFLAWVTHGPAVRHSRRVIRRYEEHHGS